TAPKHYILRTSWVIGEGNNFVRTMASLAERGIAPKVVSDQIGRLTFTTDLARAIRHLVESKAPYGTYNVTGSGEPASWADIATVVYAAVGADPASVTPVTTEEYFAGSDKLISPRPAHSTLDLAKVKATGLELRDWREGLAGYLDHGLA
ncbi:SDR family oxidoreductase, partial [Demequina salsinemoris]|uniref:SDR family oxidoreductase n=1 Tax=Demequina salsinemoris TaxID=577470 RepID=UPI000A650EF3